MNATHDPLVRDYLRTVERGLAPLPRRRREEVLGDLREHLDGALADASTEADVRSVLYRRGDPADVAASARAEAGVDIRAKRPWLEWAAMFLISVGSVVIPVLGWMAGIVMVWGSSIWRTWEKVLASVLFPLGWWGMWHLYLLIDAGDETCVTAGRVTTCTKDWTSNPVLVTLLALAIVGPVVSVAVLARTVNRHRRATAL